ncbi:MAG TPA: biotin--[acetyl-CoA-carboxylase] ligase [Rhodocyclaceae bacterium]|nr:MAG: biotin--[acetyl-CoA-carboxylase] ligase [Rhodocyclales bacterium CG17_big_fil_post_rev_8_21_14_2_50_68_7]PIX74828.1 MAG: biotin--[acetyl-CoA-carboxylase] ligase [Rhodocyclales bacterium CG_4_10_14_3_um_filter_68_10]PJA58821.1 MAG: biotin--[acetyl-CoA-carboxylase] ligase [Rhodocyclales bacterium CG_4_9_14_3_um_filter_68_10]HCX34923.1 biotin--[acetyl-CoA-carboxylase] ligase [Rhodocyclaceae bacterium]
MDNEFMFIGDRSLAGEALDADRIRAALGAAAGRFQILVRERCVSTNTELRELAEAGASHASVLVCEEQTGGRGRRGRPWHSVRGGSLTFSLLWRFPAATPAPVGLSLAIGVAVARALDDLGVAGLKLKWPNDVLHCGRKLAGILVELASGTHPGPVAVIGVGVNVALPRDFDPSGTIEATDIAGAAARRPSRNRLLAELLRSLGRDLDRYSAEGFAPFRSDWVRRAAWMGERVRLVSEFAAPLEGRLVGIDPDGALLVLGEGGVHRLASGELSLRRLL